MVDVRKLDHLQFDRLAPSLCISYSTKSDIHGIIMNPQMGGDITVRDEIRLSAPHSGKKVIQSSYNTLDKRTLGKSNNLMI